jgi:hypothetical protein
MTGTRLARQGFVRLFAILALAATIGLGGSLGAGATPASGADRYHNDVARQADFVAQTNFVQCVGASLQMMINMIEPGRDRTAATQLRLQQLARKHSPARPDNRQRKGASVRGWVRVLRMEVDQPYRLVGADTLKDAVHIAADAIETTGAPVGLLVWRGRHAWVMSGFEATKPIRDGGRVTAAVIYDPLYPYGSNVWGPSPKPGQPISLKALGRQFVPRRQSQRWGTLSGKYVLVLPYVPHNPVRRPA